MWVGAWLHIKISRSRNLVQKDRLDVARKSEFTRNRDLITKL